MNILEQLQNKNKTKVTKLEVTEVTPKKVTEVTKLQINDFSKLEGYKEVTPEVTREVTREVTKKLSPSLLKAYKASRPWILDHLEELQAKGWTRRSLFKAGRFAYPFGDWGVAWGKVWLRPGVEVSIEDDGAIAWTWLEALDRRVTQRAYPFFK